VSDRPEDRPVPNLARASARNARTRTAGRTDGTSAPRGIPDRETIREAGAEDARRSRIENGLPERVEDPAAVAALAAILRRPPSGSTRHETSLGPRFGLERLRAGRSPWDLPTATTGRAH
jgi:hypothetical protein